MTARMTAAAPPPAGPAGPAGPEGATGLLDRPDQRVDQPWQVVLWNDPVNLAPMVVRALMTVLGIDRDAAERLTLAAHRTGRAAVESADADRCAAVAGALQARALWATVEKAGR